jgi:hypothetical protein
VASADPATEMSAGDLEESVHELQKGGLNSIQIAAKMKVSLSKVNMYWDPDLAAEQGKAEEDETNL